MPMMKLLLAMTIPSVVAQLVNLLYSVVDRIFIGHIPNIGTEALAGVGVTSSTIILITAFSTIIGMGAAPLASIALGKGDLIKAKYFLGNGFILLLIFAFITTLITFLFMEPILLFTGASEFTLAYAKEYLSIYLAGSVFVLVALGLNSFIVVQGRSDIAMWAVVLGAIINIVLDYIFLFVLEWGVAGAAYATIISQACSALWIGLFLLSSKVNLALELPYMRLKRKIVFSTLALGCSPFVMSSTEALVGFVLNGSLKEFGDIHISSMAIIQSSLLVASIPLGGFAQGFMPIIGYNYGANKLDRVKQCFKLSFIIMTSFNFILILSMVAFPHIVASIFTNDVELINMVENTLPTFLIGMTLFGMQRTCQSMFIALGQAKISIFIAMLRKIILLIPLAIILPKFMGVMGIYTAESIADALAALCCVTIFIILFPKILSRKE